MDIMSATAVDCNVDLSHSFWSRVLRGDGCWLWQGPIIPNHRGSPYGSTRLNGKKTTAHRIAYTLSRGTDVPAGLVVMHACDNRLCCRPSHLSVGTYSDNTQDCIAKDRWNCRNVRRRRGAGIPVPMDVAADIAAKLDAGHVLTRLAVEHNIDETTLRHIKYRRGRFAAL